MNHLKAIEYLIENDKYTDEWSGAGMWEALLSVMSASENDLTKKYLDELLEKAEKF